MLDPRTEAPIHSDLFQPVQLGPYQLANRIVMAPLTRSRAGADGVPRPLMAEYYAQRASAGLIIAEGTNISPQGRGYADCGCGRRNRRSTASGPSPASGR